MLGPLRSRAADLPPEVAQQHGLDNGVGVAAVAPNSPAAEAGVRRGDILLQVDQQPVHSVEEVKAAIAKREGDEVVTQGGIHGKVSAVDGEVLEVEVARVRGEKVKLRVSVARIDQLTKSGQAADEK